MNNKSKTAVKRILRDISQLVEEEVNRDGIYFWSNEDNIFEMKAMIIGPDGTPYQGGFYFFDIYFPKDYPMKNPKVIYQTRIGRVRFNPNLYANGKVCLSILGTWSGPSWTPTMNVLSILQSIQALVLNECPLKNEPGYANLSKDRQHLYTSYNGIVDHWNVQHAIIGMARNIREGFDMFRDDLLAYLSNNKGKYMKHLASLKTKYRGTKKIKCPYVTQEAIGIDYDKALKELSKIIYQYDMANGKVETIDYESLKRVELCKICNDLGIDTKKTSSKTGKRINKIKKELIADILNQQKMI